MGGPQFSPKIESAEREGAEFPSPLNQEDAAMEDARYNDEAKTDNKGAAVSNLRRIMAQ